MKPLARLEWNPRTLTLIEPDAGYGRMIRLRGREQMLLCGYEKHGKSWVRRSRDNGRTWLPPTLAAQFPHGGAANPEVLQLRGGRLLLFYNARPSGEGGVHRFAIGMSVSRDNGATWTQRPSPIFEADVQGRNGCWEPAALQIPSGEILLFFANEFPYRKSDEQEISLCRSRDDGTTWSKPQPIIFRAGHRDGMPVPVLLRKNDDEDDARIAVAIEDNGLAKTGYLLQPVIVTSRLKDAWRGPSVNGDSPRRRGAVTPPLAADVYAGAPYLCQLPGGETILSCQSTEGRKAGRKKARMVVYIGDSHARNFTNRSVPFVVPENEEGLWNALMVKDADTVTALSGTVIKGIRGLWAIDGRVIRE